MKKRLLTALIFVLSGIVSAGQVNVTPKPDLIEPAGGFFRLTEDTKIVYSKGCDTEAKQLQSYLQPATGYDIQAQRRDGSPANTIMLKIDTNLANMGTEAYKLNVGTDRIAISSSTNAGLFYGIETLRQLLPVQIYSNKVQAVQWEIPCVSIEDSPGYPWRGMMLDVSRYFFNVEYVKRYLDMMAMHKMNVLHLHLVDDCGWRVQIDKYPKLTEVGGFRGTGTGRFGGYYTKDDVRQIVAHASKLHIDIVPEIELPAHCLSALVAYPWLGCKGEQFTIPTKHSISREILCGGKETSYKFLEDVMTEVAEMFPSKFIHVGGDEARYSRWEQCPDCKKKMNEQGYTDFKELQGYMTRRIEKFMMQKGKRLIGWDEILDCGLAPNATVMTWHRPQTAVTAAKAGNNVVMALTGYAYFDTPQSGLPGEPPAATWLSPISLKKAYQWEPAPDSLSDEAKKHILGGHGCLWTDQFLHRPILQDMPVLNENRSARYVDYLTLPRMSALAEVTWTAQKQRNWDDFSARQAVQYNRYTTAGYHYRVPLPVVEKSSKPDGTFVVTMTSAVEGGVLNYTTDGTYPTVYSKIYTKPIIITDLQKFGAITAVNRGHYSLAFTFPVAKEAQFAKYGVIIGQWESGEVSAGTYKPAKFDATGKINKNAVYEVTFIYTSGGQRLDIEKVEVIVNDKVVAHDEHYGTTGGQHKDNVYRLNITNYETGANYTVSANIMGDTGNDSNGVVLIKRVK
jgi:hexosaminidase